MLNNANVIPIPEWEQMNVFSSPFRYSCKFLFCLNSFWMDWINEYTRMPIVKHIDKEMWRIPCISRLHCWHGTNKQILVHTDNWPPRVVETESEEKIIAFIQPWMWASIVQFLVVYRLMGFYCHWHCMLKYILVYPPNPMAISTHKWTTTKNQLK